MPQIPDLRFGIGLSDSQRQQVEEELQEYRREEFENDLEKSKKIKDLNYKLQSHERMINALNIEVLEHRHGINDHKERLYALEERIDRQRGQIIWMEIVVFVLIVLAIYLVGITVSPV